MDVWRRVKLFTRLGAKITLKITLKGETGH
jgi:hypothetical protein